MLFVSILTLSSLLLQAISADLIRGLSVPQYAFAGATATLSCEFDLRQTQLYSLKWYHNKTEFYRYVPTERKGPITIRPTPHFKPHEVSRNEQIVVLKLSNLTPFASGFYLCEVLAEHPSFRTEKLEAKMTVLKDLLYPPRIVGVKEIYEPEETIELACQPYEHPESSPQPAIKWYLNGTMVGPQRYANLAKPRKGESFGAVLKLPAKEIVDLGGTSKVECRLVLGNHQEKTSKNLRVRMRQISYVIPLFSPGSRLAFDVFYSLLTIFLSLYF